MVPYMVTERNAQGMSVGHVKYLWNCNESATDLLQIAMDRFVKEKIAQRIGLVTVFHSVKPFPCQSLADPVRCFYGYLLH